MKSHNNYRPGDVADTLQTISDMSTTFGRGPADVPSDHLVTAVVA